MENHRQTVKDESGIPLPGVTVALKGTTIGTATDAGAGKFKFEFSKRDSVVLVFSFVGMKTQEREIKSVETKDLIIVMKPDVDELGEEVIITGFGTKSANSYTGAATTGKAGTVVECGVLKSLSTQSLAAFVPGMQIVTNNGDADSDPSTRPCKF